MKWIYPEYLSSIPSVNSDIVAWTKNQRKEITHLATEFASIHFLASHCSVCKVKMKYQAKCKQASTIYRWMLYFKRDTFAICGF